MILGSPRKRRYANPWKVTPAPVSGRAAPARTPAGRRRGPSIGGSRRYAAGPGVSLPMALRSSSLSHRSGRETARSGYAGRTERMSTAGRVVSWLSQYVLKTMQDCVVVGTFRDAGVQRDKRLLGRQRPQMHMMHVQHPVHGPCHLSPQDLDIQAFRRSFHQHVPRFGDQSSGAADDEQCHQYRKDGVDRGPAGQQNHGCGDDGSDRTEQIA
jgi:hypothetical protein